MKLADIKRAVKDLKLVTYADRNGRYRSIVHAANVEEALRRHRRGEIVLERQREDGQWEPLPIPAESK